MKQREDNKTLDMFGGLRPTVYTFHVETTDGEIIEWHGLTLDKAIKMNSYTNGSQPSNVKSYGWEATA